VRRFLFSFVWLTAAACGGHTFVGVSTDAGSSDDASSDGGASDAASDGAADATGSGNACAKLSNLVDTCNSDTDCVAVPHQTDCCGSIMYIGINQTFRNEFQTLEAKNSEACGKCQCRSQPLTTQDGHTVSDASKVGVHCSSHQCRTVAN
jgi:hypothetical protein